MTERVADIREIVETAKKQHAPVYPQFRALGDIAYLLDTLEAVEAWRKEWRGSRADWDALKAILEGGER